MSNPVQEAFDAAKGKWQGCDWEEIRTIEGCDRDLRKCSALDLRYELEQHIHPTKAKAEWAAAYSWLSMCEEAAEDCEQRAESALEAYERGELIESYNLIKSAVQIERTWHRPQDMVWVRMMREIAREVARRLPAMDDVHSLLVAADVASELSRIDSDDSDPATRNLYGGTTEEIIARISAEQCEEAGR